MQIGLSKEPLTEGSFVSVEDEIKRLENVAEEYLQISSIEGEIGTLLRLAMACMICGVILEYGQKDKKMAESYYHRAELYMGKIQTIKKMKGTYIKHIESQLEMNIHILQEKGEK